jgi:hypothetical protein
MSNIYVVYQVSMWSGFTRNALPVAAFTTLKAANAYKRDKDARARDYYYRVRKLNLEG